METTGRFGMAQPPSRGDIQKPPSLEVQSLKVLELSRELFKLIDDFSDAMTKGDINNPQPTPMMDAVSNISNNLKDTEGSLKAALEAFIRLKERIRN